MATDSEPASIAFLAEKLISELDLGVDFCRSKFDGRHLPERLENQIESIWAKRKEQNPKLWNGSKFRLAKIERRYEQNAAYWRHLIAV